jgi:hypothetical protein
MYVRPTAAAKRRTGEEEKGRNYLLVNHSATVVENDKSSPFLPFSRFSLGSNAA